MVKSLLAIIVRAGVAFLVTVSLNLRAEAATLREEALAYRTQGYEAQRRGDFVVALAFYRKAAALDPAYPTPYNDMGTVLEQQGRLDEAERAYQEALLRKPDLLEAHANLAMLDERRGHTEEAIAHWTKRYQLGTPADPGTARAAERLTALGVSLASLGSRGGLVARYRLADEELSTHQQSREEYRAVTRQHGDWP